MSPRPPRANAPSIRLIAAIFVVIPVVVVAGALLVLFSITGQRAGEALGASIIDRASGMVAEDVKQYLGEAVRVSDLYQRRIKDGTLDTVDLEAWERPMLDDLVTSANVASICFGSSTDRSIYLQHAHDRLELGVGEGPGADQCREYEIDLITGERAGSPLRVYRYVPTERPWYAAAIEAGGATWTPVYFWFATQRGDSVTGAGFATPIFEHFPGRASPDGRLAGAGSQAVQVGGTDQTTPRLLGVLTVDVTLSDLSTFLRKIPVGEGGHLFLVDSQGLLVASTEGPVNSPQGNRLGLSDTTGSVARAAARGLERSRPRAAPREATAEAPTPDEGAAEAIVLRPVLNERLRLDKGWARVAVTPVTPFPGMDWQLITVIPESAFLGDAWAARNRAMIVAAVAIIGAALLALQLAGRLVQPIVALRTHVKRLARGEFDTPLDLRAARELQDLSSDLNAAAIDLKSHVEMKHSLELAMQVQQSLLPDKPPTPPGLDLAGKSMYCDETGGDYFDFIDVRPATPEEAARERGDSVDGPMPAALASRPATLIVVGDVMGHGIAAALLMATARATLRLRARQPASLGHILTDVNNVLAPDFRDGRFMTMALIVIDPVARTARWASAGHDAPIIYEPGKGEFRVLEGGEFPLGVVEGADFREYVVEDIEPGAIVAIGTDGIWEAAGPDGEQFGHDRLRDLIKGNAGRTSAQIAAAIDKALADYLGPNRNKDDVTYAIARMVGG